MLQQQCCTYLHRRQRPMEFNFNMDNMLVIQKLRGQDEVGRPCQSKKVIDALGSC